MSHRSKQSGPCAFEPRPVRKGSPSKGRNMPMESITGRDCNVETGFSASGRSPGWSTCAQCSCAPDPVLGQ
eukprot:2007047-Amphidinium_carterae.1